MEMWPEKHWRHIPFDEVCENCRMTNVQTTSLRASDNIKVEQGHHGLGVGYVVTSKPHTPKKKQNKTIYLNI
jgi:hypothetical protein